MEYKRDFRESHSDEKGSKPDFVGAGFASWMGVSKNGKQNICLKDERTGKTVYLHETTKK